MSRASLTAVAALGCLTAAFLAHGFCGNAFGLGTQAPQRAAARNAAWLGGGRDGAGSALGGGARPPPGLCCGAAGIVAAAAAAAVLSGRHGRGSTSSPWLSRQRRGAAERTSLRYTTQQILPSLSWLQAGFKSKDLDGGDIRVVCLSGCDVCVGKTGAGKIFAIGDKAPPTGISFSAGADVQGDSIVEPQYGNSFNVFTGLPEGPWCPTPPIIGGVIAFIMGGPQAVAVFEVREALFGGDIEVLVDTNAKRAYEADYWKGLLDAQGKDDGSYY